MILIRPRETSKINKLVIALALFVNLLSCFNAANAFVVCVGSDGHVVVESALLSPCNQLRDKENSISEIIIVGNTCTDTFIPSNLLSKGFITYNSLDFEINFDQPKPWVNPLDFSQIHYRDFSLKKSLPYNLGFNILETIVLTI